MAVKLVKDQSISLQAMIDAGFFLRHITGKEHARTLHHECVHGSWMSSGHPQALVFGDQVIATINGNEPCCAETLDTIFQAIDTVRGLQGMQPAFRNPW